MFRILTTAAVVTFLFPAIASAEFQWGNRHWENPQSITVVDYGAGKAKNAAKWRRTRDQALAAWERSGVIGFRVKERQGPMCVDSDRKAVRRAKRQFPDGQISLCKWRGGNWTIAGWASVPPGPGGVIREAVVAVASPNTLCHELGHALGLDHPEGEEQGEDASCLGYGPWNSPSAHDLAELARIYG